MKFVVAVLTLLSSLGVTNQDADHVEDFEKTPGPDSVYEGWEPVRSPEYPSYNSVRLVKDPPDAKSGQQYLTFRTQGGATAFQMLKKSAWKIDPTRSYRFSAWARPSGTRSNVAYVTLTWMNKRFDPIKEDRTTPVSEAGSWTAIALDVPHLPPDALWVAIRLNFEGHDVRGECSFDRLALTGQARLLVAPKDLPLPVFEPGAAPQIVVTAPGLEGKDHGLEVTTTDLWGKVAFQSARMPISADVPVIVTLPPHEPGYYDIHASVSNASGVVLRRTSPLVVPNPWLSPSDSPRLFGGAFNPFTTDYAGAGELAKLGGLQQVKVTLWDRVSAGRQKAPDPSQIFALTQGLTQEEKVIVTGVLSIPTRDQVPDVERVLLDNGPLALFGLEPHLWEGALRATVERNREHVSRWQIGGDDDASALAGAATGADAAFTAAAGVIRKLDRLARVGVPVPAKGPAKPENAEFFSRVLPGDMAEEKTQRIGRDVSLVLSLPPLPPGERAEALRAQTAALLRRLVTTAAAGGEASAAFLPVDGRALGGMLDSDGHPGPLFLALRAANDLLSGATRNREFSLFEDPVKNFIFDKGPESVVALWSEREEVEKEIFFGHDALIYPPLGTVHPHRPGEKIRIGPMPVFVARVDSLLLKTQLSLMFHRPEDPLTRDPVLPLRVESTTRVLTLKNHFKDSELRDVRIRIEEPVPSGWRIEPRGAGVVSVPGGKTFSREFTFTLPTTETEGPRELNMELSYTREGKAYVLKTPQTLNVVPLIEVSAEVTAIPGDPKDRRVSIVVTNRADRPLNVVARIRLPGDSEKTEPLGQIPKDASARKLEYRVRDIASLDPKRRQVEILCEDRGPDRLHTRKLVPLK